MFQLPQGHFMRKGALEAVLDLFRPVLTKPLDEAHVDFEVDALNSKLLVKSRDISKHDESGKYAGTYQWNYKKVPLHLALPYPLLVRLDYPVRYDRLKAYLKETFGLLVEDYDLALFVDGAPLGNRDVISKPWEPVGGTITLFATALSGRFVKNSRIVLTIAAASGPTRLNALVAIPEPLSLGALTDIAA